jgi:MFS family permease
MPDLRRNRRCLLADAIGWPLGQSFLAPQTIIATFTARLTGSNVLVGVMAGLQAACQLLPQLLAAHWVERLRRTRLYVVVIGVVVERLPVLVLAFAVLTIRSPGTLVAVFFACWALMNLGTGVNMPAFMALFAKSLPPENRGRVTGLGNSVGTLLAAGGAVLASRLLQSSSGLRGYAWCFLIGFVVLIASVLPLAFVDEPEEQPSKGRSIMGHLRGLAALLGSRDFLWYVGLHVLLNLCLAGTSLLTGFAVLSLKISDSTIALGSAVLMAATALSSLTFGLIADRRGYRLIFVFGSLCALLLYLPVLVRPGLPAVLFAYGMAGALTSSLIVGGNMTMEFAGVRRTATYTAVVFTAVAPARAGGPVLLGWLAAAAGTPVLFAVLAATALLALLLCLAKLRDPRTAGQPLEKGT